MTALSLDWLLHGEPIAPAIGFPDGRTVSYAELAEAVRARPTPGRQRPMPLSSATGYEQLLDALAAFAGGAVAVPQGPIDASRQLDARAALLIYTSGSTGGPKGVLLSRDGIAANVEAILGYLPIATVRDTALVLPLHYSYALVGQALTTLRAGGTLWLLNGLEFATQKLEAMARIGRPLGLSSVPTQLRVLAKAQLETKAQVKLGYVASAGGKLERSTVDQVRAAFGAVRFFNQYGLTEASPRVTALSDEEPAFAFGSVGQALPGLNVFAVGSTWQRLPTGASGELVVRGPSVMLGYLDDVEGTQRVLAADGTLRTGDWGHVDRDGYVFVEGRKDGVVKVAGERVSVEAIADVLRGVAPELAVVAVADEALGAKLIAVVEGDDGVVRALRAKGRELPAPQRPARYVTVQRLPKTPNGKIDLAAVRALAEKP